jgi:hypothetical protein
VMGKDKNLGTLFPISGISFLHFHWLNLTVSYRYATYDSDLML